MSSQLTERPEPQSSGCYAICPWCGYKHGDCWEWVKEITTQTRCDSCDNMFSVQADVSVSYRSWVSGEEKPF